MRRLPRVTGKDAERVILKAGWYVHHSRGSHFYYRHSDKPSGRICIPMHAGEIIAPKLLKGILEDAGLSVEEFIKLLRG